jgi:hypothetical protein
MEANVNEYGQMDFNLPHDVVKLPTKGIFYKPKKESLKIGYLTAQDENVLMSSNTNSEGIISTLLRNKIYEPGFDIGQLLNVDIQAILLFLRNTSFGPEYTFSIKDSNTGRDFEATIILDEINIIQPKHLPNDEGFYDFRLPKTGRNLKLKLLTLSDDKEIDKISESYPQGMVAPVVTKKLEKHVVEMDGDTDRGKIVTFIPQMPIKDSKDLQKFILECEPKLDLKRTITTPSGEKVTVNVAFGVEFFRPFFQ